MIGPIAPGAPFLTAIDYEVTPTQPGVRLYASDGSIATARSTSSIVNLGGLTRGKMLVAPATPGWYLPKWDDSDGAQFGDESVWVSSILSDILAGGGGGGGGTTVPPILIGDANADLLGRTFTIKRNDTIPYLRRQLGRRTYDPVTGALVVDSSRNPVLAPVDLTDMADGFFIMRRQGTNVSPDTGAAAPKVHKAFAVVGDPTDGIAEYRWAEDFTDTNETTDGGQHFAGEFEVTWLDGTTETFPQVGYIDITIPIDLDPGVNP